MCVRTRQDDFLRFALGKASEINEAAQVWASIYGEHGTAPARARQHLSRMMDSSLRDRALTLSSDALPPWPEGDGTEKELLFHEVGLEERYCQACAWSHDRRALCSVPCRDQLARQIVAVGVRSSSAGKDPSGLSAVPREDAEESLLHHRSSMRTFYPLPTPTRLRPYLETHPSVCLACSVWAQYVENFFIPPGLASTVRCARSPHSMRVRA
jgi:hypothetical protein